MNLYLVGCEFAGKTALAGEILRWGEGAMGGIRHFHDHFTVPSTEMDPAARASYRDSHPQVKEMLQRFMIDYHCGPAWYLEPDANLMGFAIEEAVYAPLYYGYGGADSQAPARSPEGQRTEMARRMEERLIEYAPNTVLVLMRADPEVIRRRMRECPEPGPDDPTRGVVRAEDVEHVLQRFEEEFEAALLANKIVLDTTSATVGETLAEFLDKHEPFLTEADRERLRRHQ